MKRTVRSVLALLLASMLMMTAGCSKPAAEGSGTVDEYADVDFLISADELKELLGSEDLVLLDCNTPEVYEKGHIPGAISVGYHAFSDTVGQPGDPGWGTIVPKEEMTTRLEALGITNDKTVVCYSDVFQGPGADGRAVWQMKIAGLDNVKFLMGGLSNWEALGYETTKEVTEPTPATGVVLKDYDESYIATKEYVYEHLDDQVIIDVRTAKEFGGSQNSGEPRGGHIAGAVNLLWQDLLNDNGTPKSKDEITAIMAEYGVEPNDDFVVY